MTTSPAGRNDPIELLRGIAALTVALVHLTFGFARFVDGRIPDVPDAGRIAQVAVATFFVISGAVMVLAAGPRARHAIGPRAFWSRRAIRVLPSYWIATALFVPLAVWTSTPIEAGNVVRSLAFVPPSTRADMPFVPFLWPGWTLAFELVFYTVFGACLLAGRAVAVVLCVAVLMALVLAGWAINPDHYFARLITAPHLLLFAAGLGFGTALARGWNVPPVVRISAALAVPVAFAVIPASWGWAGSAGVPGVLAFIVVAGGPVPTWLCRPARLLGEASYALYLLHVPFAHAWMKVFQTWIGEPGGSIGYLALGVPLLLVLSLAFHRRVERPLGRALNRLARSDRAHLNRPGPLPHPAP